MAAARRGGGRGASPRHAGLVSSRQGLVAVGPRVHYRSAAVLYCTVQYSTVLARLLYCTVVPYCTVRVTQSAGAPDRDTPEGTNTGYKPYRGCGGGAHERATTPRRVRIVSRGAQREPAEGLGYFNLRGVKLEPAEATTTTKRGQRHPLETGKQRTQR